MSSPFVKMVVFMMVSLLLTVSSQFRVGVHFGHLLALLSRNNLYSNTPFRLVLLYPFHQRTVGDSPDPGQV